MSAHLNCNNCRRAVIAIDPATLVTPAAGAAIAALWIEHAHDCPRTCRWCMGEKSHGNALSCARDECKAKARDQRTRDRMDDIETLLIRTSDPDIIARHVGLNDGRALRLWLSKNGRRDLITGDGPLAPITGVAA